MYPYLSIAINILKDDDSLHVSMFNMQSDQIQSHTMFYLDKFNTEYKKVFVLQKSTALQVLEGRNHPTCKFI